MWLFRSKPKAQPLRSTIDGATVEALLDLALKGRKRNVLRFVSRLPGRDNRRWFCSELVFKAIEKTHLRVLQMTAEYVDPGHLATSPYLMRDEPFELMVQENFNDDSPS